MVDNSDPFDLARFVAAQAAIYDQALAELRNGRKTSHWMWFIFPQLRGLGSSTRAMFFGIGSVAEARAYLAHNALGPRLLACTTLVLAIQDRTLHEIFGSPDDLKFQSCMTLFAHIAGTETRFSQALDRYCDGRHDAQTLRLLGA